MPMRQGRKGNDDYTLKCWVYLLLKLVIVSPGPILTKL